MSHHPSSTDILALTFVPHSNRLVAGDSEGRLRVYDSDKLLNLNDDSSPPVITTFEQGYHGFSSCSVNSSGRLMMVSGRQNQLWLYDMETGNVVDKFFDLHPEHVNVIKFTHSAPSVFGTASFDGTVSIWDLRTRVRQGSNVRNFVTKTRSAGLSFSAECLSVYDYMAVNSGRYAPVSPIGGVISDYDMISQGSADAVSPSSPRMFPHRMQTPFGVPLLKPIHSSRRSAQCILGAFSYDDANYLISSCDNDVAEYSVGSGACIQTYDIPKTNTDDCYTRSYYSGRDSRHIITGSNEGLLRVLDASTGRIVRDVDFNKTTATSTYIQSLRDDIHHHLQGSVIIGSRMSPSSGYTLSLCTFDLKRTAPR